MTTLSKATSHYFDPLYHRSAVFGFDGAKANREKFGRSFGRLAKKQCAFPVVEINVGNENIINFWHLFIVLFHNMYQLSIFLFLVVTVVVNAINKSRTKRHN